jgi:hypothetical protein
MDFYNVDVTTASSIASVVLALVQTILQFKQTEPPSKKRQTAPPTKKGQMGVLYLR